MRSYATIWRTFYTDGTAAFIRSLPELEAERAQHLALYLQSSPHASAVGVFYLPVAYIVQDTKIPLEGALKALRSLIEADFCRYDWKLETVWVVGMAATQIGETVSPRDNRHKMVTEEVRKLKGTAFFADFLARYSGPFALEIEAPPEPLPSQEQEQGQEQDQEQGKKTLASGPTRRPAPPDPGDVDADALFWIPISGEPPRKRTFGPARRVGDGWEFGITAEHVATLRELYPAVDVDRELLKIQDWNRDNPQRRKTYPKGTGSGVRSHVKSWLENEQNRARSGWRRPDRRGAGGTAAQDGAARAIDA
jgi:hypothetical protein